MKALLALAGVLSAHAAAASTAEATEAEIRDRLAPFGTSCLVGAGVCAGVAEAAAPTPAATSSAPMTGQQVYDRFCFACHAQGVGEAPLLQDADQWAQRLEKGMDELLRTSIQGLGAMPPKGTCMTCSDDEMVAAIRYLTGT